MASVGMGFDRAGRPIGPPRVVTPEWGAMLFHVAHLAVIGYARTP